MSTAQPALAGHVRVRVAVIGDPHLEERAFPWLLPVWDAMIEQVIAAQPDHIIITGDLAGGRDTRHVWTLAELREIVPRLRHLSEHAPVLIVAGNHDHPRVLDWLPSISGRYPITVAQEPALVRLPDGHGLVYLLPYPGKGALLKGRTFQTLDEEREAMNAALAERLERFGAYVQTLREDYPGEPIIVATHATWHGALPGGGEIFQPGGDVTVEPTTLAALGVDLVVGGHIHKPGAIWDRGYLVGSVYQGGHGEGGDDRYWWLFDLAEKVHPASALEACVFPDEGRLGLEVYRYPTGAPRRQTIRMRWDGAVLDGPEDFRPEALEGVQLRVIIEADEEHEATIPWGGLDHTFADLDWSPEKRITRTQREARSAALESARTPLEKLLAWAEATGVSVDEERRKRLHDRIEGDARDVASTLASAHPRHGDLIHFATRRDT